MFTRMIRRSAGALAVAGGLSLLLASGAPSLTADAHSASTTCGATDTHCVITFGDNAIAARQTALATLNSRVTEVYTDGRITSDDNTALTSDISTNESGLSSLKSQLDGASDATAARQDVKLIYTQFRIFAVVLPRDYHEIWVDMLVHTDNRLKGSETLIQDAINGAPSGVQGQANQLYTDYQTQVTNAQAQTQAAQALESQLTPPNFNASQSGYDTTFGSFKTDIGSAHTDTKAAISDLHQIVTLLKGAGVQ